MIDALRLQSWNYGMLNLLNMCGIEEWTSKELKVLQNLSVKTTSDEFHKSRKFLQDFFAPTPEYVDFCKGHLMVT